jgi:hypothetical protein
MKVLEIVDLTLGSGLIMGDLPDETHEISALKRGLDVSQIVFR